LTVRLHQVDQHLFAPPAGKFRRGVAVLVAQGRIRTQRQQRRDDDRARFGRRPGDAAYQRGRAVDVELDIDTGLGREVVDRVRVADTNSDGKRAAIIEHLRIARDQCGGKRILPGLNFLLQFIDALLLPMRAGCAGREQNCQRQYA
jgi:hypothetical protein